MADDELYRIDVVIGQNGAEIVKQELKDVDKAMDATKKRGEALSRIKVSPAARLDDRLSGPTRQAISLLSRIPRSLTSRVSLSDRTSAPLANISRKLSDVNRITSVTLSARLDDRISEAARAASDAAARIGDVHTKATASLDDRLTAPARAAGDAAARIGDVRATATATLDDKLSNQAKAVTDTASRLGQLHAEPVVSLRDKATGFLRAVRGAVSSLGRQRASPEARLIDRVTGAARKASSAVRGLTSKTWEVTIRAKDLATGTISRIKSTVLSLPGMVGLGAGAYGTVIAPLKVSGDFEQADIAFETMLKSGEKAKSFMAELKDFAERTPFDFPGVRDAAQRMLAFKFAQKDIIPDLTAIGDWAGAMGKGKEGIDRVVLALGQMKAKGRVQGDEMLQLTEAGINAYDYLSKAMGVSTAKVMELQSKGLLPAEQSIRAIIDGMNKDFGGGMKKQESTLFGLWNRIKETFNNKLLFKWGEGIRLGIQPRLLKIGDWLDRNQDTIQRWGNTLQKISGQATDWVMRKFERLFALFDDPAFQNADFLGKLKIAWDELISDPFEEWWQAGGEAKMNRVAEKMGSAIGGTLGGLIMGALGIAAGDGAADESPFVQAGRTAGTAFLTSFLDAFDAGKIAQKAVESFKNAHINAIENPTADNLISLGIKDIVGGYLVAWGLNKIFKPFKLVKNLFGRGAATAASTAVETVAGSATRSAATVAAESGAEKTLVKGNPKSPYSPGWNPRNATPPKPETPLPKTWRPGIPTVGKFVRSLFGPETLPFLAGSVISSQLIQQDLAQKAAFKEQFANDPVMLEWGKLPEWQRFGVNTGNVITRQQVTAVPTPSKELTQAQVDSVANYLASNIKPETKNLINVTVPPGAVQITMPTTEPDYDVISHIVGTNIVTEIRKSFENR